MNALASSLLWLSVQVALFSLVGCAVFYTARRRGPQAAATCTTIVLALTLILTLLIASPWPRWMSPKSTAKSAPVALVQPVDAPVADATGSPEVTTPADAGSTSLLAVWWDTTVEFLRNTQATPNAETNSLPAWQTWLPWLVAAGIGLCCLRLMLGVWAVSSLRRGSQRIEDAELLALIKSIAGQVGAGEVEARETAMLRSAVTVGWRKPVLLLPMDWPFWTDAERRAVLAHELVHVSRSDYATAFLARVTTAIHFYQPLVLWLNRQLRMQQELAADSQAAIVSGNRQTYLATLAQLALRADEQALPWAARAFLPNTSSLIKRVAWLKRKGNPMEKTLGNTGRFILAALMAAIALGVAGIRGPGDVANTAVAQQAAPQQQDNPLPQGAFRVQTVPVGPTRGTFTLQTQIQQEQPAPTGATLQLQGQGSLNAQSGGTLAGHTNVVGTTTLNLVPAGATPKRSMQFVPADAKLVVAASPSEIAKLASGQKLVAAFTDHGFDRKFGIKGSDLADVQFVMRGIPDPNRVILRTVQPHDWKTATLDRAFPDLKTKQFGDKGKTYYVLKDKSEISKAGDLGPAFFVVDDRTLVAGSEDDIKHVIAGDEKLMAAEEFPMFAHGEIAAWVDGSLIQQVVGQTKQSLESNPALAMLQPLLSQINSASAWVGIMRPNGADSETIRVFANIDCQTAAAADQIVKVFEAARIFGANLLAVKDAAWREAAAPPVPQEQIVAMADFIRALKKALAKAEIVASDAKVLSGTEIELGPPVVAAFVMPAIAASRESAMRQQSMSNMKQLGLAMLMYVSKEKHFPPAAIRGKDGKPLLSWRVAVLPYLQELELYQQFHLDEPWDSEHNKALIAKMPVFLRDPHDDSSSTNASYFMPTGKGTIGESETGTKLKDVRDGTSKTLMIVEAKRDIPWTKPEDIEFDPDASKPLPVLGGNMTDGNFAGGLADGSVRIFLLGTPPNVIHALTTIAGGELISTEDLSPNSSQPSGDRAPPQSNDVRRSGTRDLTPATPEFNKSSSNQPPVLNGVGVNSDAGLKGSFTLDQSTKLEFRPGETQPAAGLTEVATPDGPGKVFVVAESGISNDDIAEATVVKDSLGQPTISIVFTPAGSEKMKKLTEQQMGKPLVIMANGKVLSAPTVRATISEKAQISGNFSQEEAERIAKGIRKK